MKMQSAYWQPARTHSYFTHSKLGKAEKNFLIGVWGDDTICTRRRRFLALYSLFLEDAYARTTG